jgi:predicted GH43/DUF377 family glycosyl hydrolase
MMLNKGNRTKLVGIIALLLIVSIFSVGASLGQDDGQAKSHPVIDFTPLAENPVLPRGESGAWDGIEGIVFAPHVIQHEGTYYMFYSGADNDRGRPAAIGYATSEDGINWTKFGENPIIAPDDTGYDGMCVSVGVPMVEDDTWVLYYAANSQPCYGPGRYIGRATAPDPSGPWTRDEEPILEAGSEGEWDHGFIMPHSIVKTDDGYVMYYSGGTEFLVPLPRLVGMATSSDGINWNKCNDPQTIESPCEESDPIYDLTPNGEPAPLEAWAVSVIKGEERWEMFFGSTCPDMVSENCPSFLGYAVSEDGVNWMTYTDEEDRVLMPGGPECEGQWICHRLSYPSALKMDDGSYRIYYTGCDEDSPNDCEIGMATGTIQWED